MKLKSILASTINWLSAAMIFIGAVLEAYGDLIGEEARVWLTRTALFLIPGLIAAARNLRPNEPTTQVAVRAMVRGSVLSARVGLVLLTGFILACGTLTVTPEASSQIDYYLDPGPPHEVRYEVDGAVRCVGRGPQAARLRAPAGTCLIADVNGILTKVPGGCRPEAP